MLIEQPQHLTRQIHEKTFRLVLPMSISSAMLLSGTMVTILILEASHGKGTDAFRWIAALSVGPLVAAGMITLLSNVSRRRRFLELREDGIRLSDRGLIRWNRILEWTPAPWSADNRVTRITVTYRFGFGQQRWSMLLDDTGQIANLQDRFTDLSQAAR